MPSISCKWFSGGVSCAPFSSSFIHPLFLCAQTCSLLWCWPLCCSPPQGPRSTRPPRAPQGRPQGRRRRPGAPMTRWRWPLNLFSGPPNSIKTRWALHPWGNWLGLSPKLLLITLPFFFVCFFVSLSVLSWISIGGEVWLSGPLQNPITPSKVPLLQLWQGRFMCDEGKCGPERVSVLDAWFGGGFCFRRMLVYAGYLKVSLSTRFFSSG